MEDGELLETSLGRSLEAFRLAHPTHVLAVGAAPWQYLISGSGTSTIVLLAGGGGRAENMFQVMQSLEGEFRVISIGCPEAAQSVDDVVRGIDSILERESVTRAYFLGHSLGAILAECYTKSHPNRVSGMVLANSAHYSRMRFPLMSLAVMIGRLLPIRFVKGRMNASFHRLLKDCPDQDFWLLFLAEEVDMGSDIGLKNRMKCLFDAMRRCPRTRQDLGDWSGSVLILESDDETGFTPGEKASLRDLYNRAQVHVFHNAGHLSPMTRPTEFSSCVRQFLRSTRQ